MNNKNFDWDLIRSFLAAIEHGSLLGAAKALGSSQPTLGRHVAELESQLGVTLFERTGRGLRPTGMALTLAESARQMEQGALNLAQGLAKALDSEGSVRRQGQLRRKDGTLFFNELSIAPVAAPDGEVTHYVGVQSDVTERERARFALAERSARLNAVFDLSPDGFVVFDREGQMVYCNQAFVQMTGWDASQGCDIVGFDRQFVALCNPAQAYVPVAAVEPLIDGSSNAVLDILRDTGLLEYGEGIPITLLLDCRNELRWMHVGDLPDTVALSERLAALRGELGSARCAPPEPTPAAQPGPPGCGDAVCDRRSEHCGNCSADCGCIVGTECRSLSGAAPSCVVPDSAFNEP